MRPLIWMVLLSSWYEMMSNDSVRYVWLWNELCMVAGDDLLELLCRRLGAATAAFAGPTPEAPCTVRYASQ